jgi:hypothetical protein
MTRLKLLLNPNDHTSFHQSLLQRLVEPYFELVNWQEDVHYDCKDHVLVVNSIRDSTNQRCWYQTYLQDGYKIIIDNLWESPQVMYGFPDSIENCFVLQNQNWFWYNEAELIRNSLAYNYHPARHYQKLALLPMRQRRPHRDALLVYLSEILDQMVWSYTSHGRTLPNDSDINAVNFQRHFNPEWYDNTYFSIVAETLVDAPEIFVTEKTFKPMAFYHPFVVMAQAGHLKYLQHQGFETFDNLFDESYDNISDYTERLTALVAAVKNFDPVPHDQLTLKKLEHNHNQFYDQLLVETRLVNEIINPMIEYAQSR